MALIYPSLLAAPQQDLWTVVKELEPHCMGFHIDIMDTVFAPNAGIPIQTVHEIAKKTFRQLWVHLMVENPESYLCQLKLPPQSLVTFHIESKKRTREFINRIIENKWLPGLAVNPKTGVDEIFPFLESLHHVLLMSVEPGFAGQPFIPSVMAKIDPLVGIRATSKVSFKIAMDGGLTVQTIPPVVQKGVDMLAVGSEIFKAKVGAEKALHLINQLAGAYK